MEECVAGIMKDHEGEKDFDKGNAIAICHNRIMGEFVVEIVEDPTSINEALGANYMPGELLRFEGMELAHVGTNANQDEYNDDNIGELASTLPLMPITDEHGRDRVVGVFTAAKKTGDGALSTDGLVYARRFPEVAQDILEGIKRPSVEAYADVAMCSICGEEFITAKDYCNHLRDRRGSGASRRFKNMHAVGGGVVRRPADSRAKFDMDSIYIMASHEEAHPEAERGDLATFLAVLAFGEDQPDDGVLEAAKKKWSKDVDLDEGSLTALGWPSGQKIASNIENGKVSYAKAIQKLGYLANVSKDSATASKARSIMQMLKNRFRKQKSEGSMTIEEVQAQLDEALAKLGLLETSNADLTSKLDEVQASLDAANAGLEAANVSLAAKDEEVAGLQSSLAGVKEANRRMVLAHIFTEEEFDAQKEAIMAMPEAAVTVFAAKFEDTPQPKSEQLKTNLGGSGEDHDGTKKLGL